MAWTTINQTYATPHEKNAWAHLPSGGWHQINPTTASGVTNVLLLLALGKANGKQANVVADGSKKITAVYL